MERNIYSPDRQKYTDSSTYYDRVITVNGTPGVPQTFIERKRTKQMFGVNTPKFHKRLKAGELLPLTSYDYFEEDGSGSMEWDITFDTYNQTCPKSPIEGQFPSWTSMHAQFAEVLPALTHEYYVQAAAAKVYSQGFDALTFFAEIHKTVRMFKNIASKVKAAADRRLFLDKEWLEGRYGWRILVFEMIDLSKLIEKLNKDRVVRFRESSGQTLPRLTVVNSVTRALGGAGTYDIVYEDSVTVGVRGTVVADITAPLIQLNPFVTAWELTKFSFVIDWFVNVGQYLESVSFQLLQQQFFAARGTRYFFERKLYIENWEPAEDWSGDVSGLGYHTWTVIQRRPTTVSIIPQLKLRLDEFKILDLVSLMLGSLRRL